MGIVVDGQAQQLKFRIVVLGWCRNTHAESIADCPVGSTTDPSSIVRNFVVVPDIRQLIFTVNPDRLTYAVPVNRDDPCVRIALRIIVIDAWHFGNYRMVDFAAFDHDDVIDSNFDRDVVGE